MLAEETRQSIYSVLVICIFQLLDAAFAKPEQARFMVRDRIEEFRGSGGVSVENFYFSMHAGKEITSVFLYCTVEPVIYDHSVVPMFMVVNERWS